MTNTETTNPELHATTQAENETGSASPLGALGISSSLFIFQLINFAIVAAIIWFLILKPLTKKMTERQALIDESLDNAKKIQENLRHSEQKYQEKIDEAKAEAGKILEKAGVESERIGNDLKAKAKTEIETLVEQAKRNINSDREDMVVEIKKSAAELVTAALEKILSEKMTEKKDQQLIEEMLKKIN